MAIVPDDVCLSCSSSALFLWWFKFWNLKAVFDCWSVLCLFSTSVKGGAVPLCGTARPDSTLTDTSLSLIFFWRSLFCAYKISRNLWIWLKLTGFQLVLHLRLWCRQWMCPLLSASVCWLCTFILWTIPVVTGSEQQHSTGLKNETLVGSTKFWFFSSWGNSYLDIFYTSFSTIWNFRVFRDFTTKSKRKTRV